MVATHALEPAIGVRTPVDDPSPLLAFDSASLGSTAAHDLSSWPKATQNTLTAAAGVTVQSAVVSASSSLYQTATASWPHPYIGWLSRWACSITTFGCASSYELMSASRSAN